MRLDKNYTIKVEKSNSYTDSFDEVIDLVIEAKESGRITSKDASILLGIAINKQNAQEVKDFLRTLFRASMEKTEKHTLFIQLKNKTTSYAS